MTVRLHARPNPACGDGHTARAGMLHCHWLHGQCERCSVGDAASERKRSQDDCAGDIEQNLRRRYGVRSRPPGAYGLLPSKTSCCFVAATCFQCRLGMSAVSALSQCQVQNIVPRKSNGIGKSHQTALDEINKAR
eukprot:6213808-Pleurochrysis_carterae.AAC.2